MTENLCHCGKDMKGSDHCPRCGCEEFEGDCGQRPAQQRVEFFDLPPGLQLTFSNGWTVSIIQKGEVWSWNEKLERDYPAAPIGWRSADEIGEFIAEVQSFGPDGPWPED